MGFSNHWTKSWGPDPPRTFFHKSDLKSSGHSKSKPTLGSSKPWDSTPVFFGRRLIVLNLVVFVVQTFLVLQCDMFVFETSHTCLLGAKHGRQHLDLMWLQNQRMMLIKRMVQLDTSVHFCCFVSFRLSYWCYDIMISEGRDLQVECFRPRWTSKGYVFVVYFIYHNGFLYI